MLFQLAHFKTATVLKLINNEEHSEDVPLFKGEDCEVDLGDGGFGTVSVNVACVYGREEEEFALCHHLKAKVTVANVPEVNNLLKWKLYAGWSEGIHYQIRGKYWSLLNQGEESWSQVRLGAKSPRIGSE